jgi:hypothetical protein
MIDKYEKVRNEKIKEIQFIGRNICKILNFPFDLIQSKKRNIDISPIRYAIWKYVRESTTHSFELIGAAIGERDHTTVMSGINSFNNDLAIDKRCRYDSLLNGKKITLQQFYKELLIKIKSSKELWVNISLYYQISNFGRVRSLDRKVEYGFSTRKIKGKILSPKINHDGFYIIILQEDKFKKAIPIHRYVALNFVENKYNRPTVKHIDGNRLNNHYTNLIWI